MKRLWVCAAVLIFSVGMGKWVWADEGAPVVTSNIGDLSARGWFIQQEATIAKDPEAMGIYAVQKAVELMQDQNQTVDQQSDALQKMLYDTKSHAVAREIRLRLIELYRKAGRADKAMEQIQALVTEQPA
jgi:lipopolysaccharide biosynthesis regulator YciM